MHYQTIRESKGEVVGTQVSIIKRQRSTDGETLSTLKGLFFKSLTLQKRNYCSNICQILTPILCLLFTLAVKEIVGGITTGAIKDFQTPQPFNQPILNGIIKSQLGLVCQEIFYYQNAASSQSWVNRILNMQQKSYCSSSKGLNPVFIKKGSVNKGIIECLNRADKLNFQRGDDLNTQIPDGYIKFNQVSQNKVNATLGINDFRLPQYHKNNGITKIIVKTSVTSTISTYYRVTEGMMTIIDKITRPFLQLHNKNQIINGFYMYMPFSGQDKTFINNMINGLGSGLYPLGLSILLPLFLYVIVSQKQQKQLQIMKMNGLNIKYYWVNFFIVSFIITMISSLNMYIFAHFLDITFFTQTAFSIIWLMFITWAIAQISMTSLFQIFINNSKSATIVGYILSVFSTLVGLTITTVIYPYPMKVPTYLLMYPPFSLSRIVFLIGLACSDERLCYNSIWNIDAQVLQCLILLFSWLSLYFLSIWLNEMIQQEYGVAHRPLIIQKCLDFFKKKKKSQLIQEFEQAHYKQEGDGIQMNEMQSQRIFSNRQIDDISVKDHSQVVRQSNVNIEPLLILDLKKMYENNNGEIGKVALKELNLKLNKGQIFGFLGPNGAGKTTLISVLTGMYPQSSGNAWIQGNEIGHSNTNKMIGVCPQFDILWKDLTVQQHLIFYSRLKNVKKELISQTVDQLMRNVDLYNDKWLAAKELSGGMQRRLSIAIALVGDPSVAILDEPSSGLDPYHRRQIWNILLKCKGKTTIFMTSHLMDEVQFLCDRIGIINQGQLKCIGTIQDLKQKFGQGYKLTISYNHLLRSYTQNMEIPLKIQKLIQNFNLTIQNQLETRIILKIQKSHIFKCINQLKHDKSFQWSINEPSLYDVFCHFVK